MPQLKGSGRNLESNLRRELKHWKHDFHILWAVTFCLMTPIITFAMWAPCGIWTSSKTKYPLDIRKRAKGALQLSLRRSASRLSQPVMGFRGVFFSLCQVRKLDRLNLATCHGIMCLVECTYGPCIS